MRRKSLIIVFAVFSSRIIIYVSIHDHIFITLCCSIYQCINVL